MTRCILVWLLFAAAVGAQVIPVGGRTRLAVEIDDVPEGVARTLSLIPGTGVTLTGSCAAGKCTVTINSTGGGGLPNALPESNYFIHRDDFCRYGTNVGDSLNSAGWQSSGFGGGTAATDSSVSEDVDYPCALGVASQSSPSAGHGTQLTLQGFNTSHGSLFWQVLAKDEWDFIWIAKRTAVEVGLYLGVIGATSTVQPAISATTGLVDGATMHGLFFRHDPALGSPDTAWNVVRCNTGSTCAVQAFTTTTPGTNYHRFRLRKTGGVVTASIDAETLTVPQDASFPSTSMRLSPVIINRTSDTTRRNSRIDYFGMMYGPLTR